MSSMASWISRASVTTLFFTINLQPRIAINKKRGEAPKSDNLFHWLTSHENRCMGTRQHPILVVIGEHREDCSIIKTKTCQHHVRTGQLEDLRIIQPL